MNNKSLKICFIVLFFAFHASYASAQGTWLQIGDMPDLVKILPPPPAFGSQEFLTDKAYYDWGVEVRASDTARCSQAKGDAVYSLETICRVFSPLCGMELSKLATPEIYGFLDTAIATADLICKIPKQTYMRTRPYVYYHSPTLAPWDEETLRNNGSYPSGHSILGMTSALLLAELFPDSSDAILQRGYQFGLNRIVCNYHWYSDVIAGFMAASFASARMHACPSFMHALQRAKKEAVKRVIFDTDMGSSTDDIFALQLLHRYMDEGRCDLIGVICDRVGNNYAAMVDLLDTYYGHGNIPIGWERECRVTKEPFINYCTQTGDRRILNNDRYNLKRTCQDQDIDSLPNGCLLYRRLLAESPDHSVSIVSVGFLVTLSHLLNSGPDTISPLSGIELVRAKVKEIYFMASKLEPSKIGKPVGLGYNASVGKMDASYADTVFSLLPDNVSVILSPSAVGKMVKYENKDVLADIKDDNHPIFLVYNNFVVDDNQYMTDVMPVIHCIEGGSLFHLSERGTCKINRESQSVVFELSPYGNVRFQYVNEENREAFKNAVMERLRATY